MVREILITLTLTLSHPGRGKIEKPGELELRETLIF